MTDRELFEKALKALELLAKHEHPLTKIQVRKPRDGGSIVTVYPHQVATDAAELLRSRLAQPIIKNYLEKDNLEPQRTHWDGCEEVHPECKKPEQEPLAYLHRQGNYWYISELHITDDEKARGWTEEPLYTAPPQRTWVGLTDEEIDAEWLELDGEASAMFKRVIRKFARAVLAKAYKENT